MQAPAPPGAAPSAVQLIRVPPGYELEQVGPGLFELRPVTTGSGASTQSQQAGPGASELQHHQQHQLQQPQQPQQQPQLQPQQQKKRAPSVLWRERQKGLIADLESQVDRCGTRILRTPCTAVLGDARNPACPPVLLHTLQNRQPNTEQVTAKLQSLQLLEKENKALRLRSSVLQRAVEGWDEQVRCGVLTWR
jgi:hypothetical protein